MQLQVQQMLGHVFDTVTTVVKLRAGSVSVHPFMVDLWKEGAGIDGGKERDTEEEREEESSSFNYLFMYVLHTDSQYFTN